MWFSDLALWTRCRSVKPGHWCPISQGTDLTQGTVLFSVPDLTVIARKRRGKYSHNYFSVIFAKI